MFSEGFYCVIYLLHNSYPVLGAYLLINRTFSVALCLFAHPLVVEGV